MIETPAGFLQVAGKPYREGVHVYAKDSHCEVINELDLEKYLNGLVNSEFNARWNEEAIAAQVVAARTYALYQIKDARRRGSHFDLDSTEKDQVYNGSIREDHRASRVVDKTKGLVLTTGTGAGIVPLKAFYHSTCGGQTELPENVWGAKYAGFRRVVNCPFCTGSPRYRWDLELSAGDLARSFVAGYRDMGKRLGWPDNALDILRQGRLIDVRVSQVDAQSRAKRVTSLWSFQGKQIALTVPGPKFREWIGTDKLKSAWFGLKPAKMLMSAADRWKIEGRGFGHGVGMCQWGAKSMGEQGYNVATILHHYYPDAILRRLW
jgi:stage II sporulation protein D